MKLQNNIYEWKETTIKPVLLVKQQRTLKNQAPSKCFKYIPFQSSLLNI